MSLTTNYSIYKTVIKRVMGDEDLLPSLPAITIKIRRALSSPNASNEELAFLISSDPGLGALLIKMANSPLFRRVNQPKTLESVIAILGRSMISNIVMAHSISSLFVFKNPVIKKLYEKSRRRQLYKAAISGFIAKEVGFKRVDEIMLISLLSEVGTLGLLSAFKDVQNIPDVSDYIKLCKEYSKSLSAILLIKWGMNKEFIEIIKSCGHWHEGAGEEIQMIDVINLGLYHTVIQTIKTPEIPALKSLAGYKKLKAPVNELSSDNQLVVVKNNQHIIDGMVKLLS